jgi:hypothetical protein
MHCHRNCEELLRGVAGDDGAAFNQLTAKASSWSHDTIKADYGDRTLHCRASRFLQAEDQ